MKSPQETTPISITHAVDGKQGPALEVADSLGIRRNKIAVEAYHISPQVCQLIEEEFRVVRSSRRLARKYKLPVHVVQDILHLGIRKDVQSERLSFVGVRRRLA